jgi:hypothetical protein
MDLTLPRGGEPRCRQVRVEVAAKEHRLKEEHRRRPDGGAAAEPREDELADQRLNLEEQEGAGEYRQSEYRNQPAFTIAGGRHGANGGVHAYRHRGSLPRSPAARG